MPCENVVARLLLKAGKARVKCRTPFTIQMLVTSENYVQNVTLGIDTGSSKIGSAAVGRDGSVLYMSEVEVRNDITAKMTQRSKYRRNRRNRKTRYRKARWLNRRNSIKTDRFSPTMRSKFDSHYKEIRFVKSLLPISHTALETATFDPHLLKDPSLHCRNWGYQKGTNYGFANTREFVLVRDGHVCQHCKGKSKDLRLEVHHIIFSSMGGSDDAENLITLCSSCHYNLHHGKLILKLSGKRKSQLKHATQMNSIRQQLLRNIACEETFGFVTKENRFRMNLPKEHYIDAVVIASGGNAVSFVQDKILLKKCVNDGDYQQTKGVRSERRIPTGKIMGFRKFDKVEYLGEQYFIKGRMSSGYAILMDISGNKQQLKPTPKFFKMERIGARKSWIMKEEAMQNIA
jgi:Restriction endonuclease